MKLITCVLVLMLVASMPVFASTAKKVKFYNFDDLLIEGQYKKPQVLYTDARQKVKFERLLKLKKDLLPKLRDTSKEPSLR